MNRKNEWLVPLTGVAVIIVGIIGFSIAGEPKSADEPVGEIVEFYVDNKDSVQIGAFMQVLAGLLLIFFGAYLRRFLRTAGEEQEMLATVAYTGFVVTAIGFAIDGTISFALAEAADDIEPAAAQALQALWDNDFLPLQLGVLAFLWGAGLAIARSGVLPRWLGWIMIVLGVVGFTPVGFVSAMGAALLVLVLSILMSLRARRPATAA